MTSADDASTYMPCHKKVHSYITKPLPSVYCTQNCYTPALLIFCGTLLNNKTILGIFFCTIVSFRQCYDRSTEQTTYRTIVEHYLLQSIAADPFFV